MITLLLAMDFIPFPGETQFLGFSRAWQAKIAQQTGNRIWTPKRSNQYEQNPKALDRWLVSVSERIEGGFHELTNAGRDLEGLLAKTIVGSATRVIAKLTSYALKNLLYQRFGIKVQMFEVAALAA